MNEEKVVINHEVSWCRRCRGVLQPGEGVLYKKAMVHFEECPEPEDVVKPNIYGGKCDLCEGWVDAGTGVAVRQDAATVTGARYRARHDGYCPADAKPAPPEGGFTAQWIAHSVGLKTDMWNPHPWVRELYKGRYGEQRTRFVRGRRDFSGANVDGSRGIVNRYTLRAGHLYEAECVVERPVGRDIARRRNRMFLIVNDEGDVKMVSEGSEEVQKWLSAC